MTTCLGLKLLLQKIYDIEDTNESEYYLNGVVYISELEITNHSIQSIYHNDRCIALYGLNLSSAVALIQ